MSGARYYNLSHRQLWYGWVDRLIGPRYSGMSSSLGASVLAVGESGDVAGVESEGSRIGIVLLYIHPICRSESLCLGPGEVMGGLYHFYNK